MYNTDESITGFAHSSFKLALGEEAEPVHVDQEHHFKKYDGSFKDIFQGALRHTFTRPSLMLQGIWYEHRLIDDMVAQMIKS